MQIGRSSLSFELPLSFEQAAAYRKANGQDVRKNQWRDTTVRDVYKRQVDIGPTTDVKEKFKDWKKTIEIENTGKADCFVRVKVIAASQ